MAKMNANISLKDLNKVNKGTLMEVLGIEYTNFGPGFLEAKMPVDERTFQPFKLLHGGASAALAETIGSFLSALEIGTEDFEIKGMQLTANHVRSARSGFVNARAEFLHKGRSTHIVDIAIKDNEGKMVSTCRLTNAIIKK